MHLRGLIQKVMSHTLAKSSAIVFAGTMTANVFAYVYHLLMGRLLGPAGYGELSSLISLLYVFSVPLTVANTVIVKYVSGFKARGEMGQAKFLFLKLTKVFAVISIMGFPIAYIAAPTIASFLHLNSPVLFVWVYLLLVLSLLTVAALGTLTGYQKFIWVSVLGAAGLLLKVVLSIPAVSWGVSGVLGAAVLASFVGYVWFFIPLRFILRAKAKPTGLTGRDAFRYAVPTFLTLLGITSLYSTDIILVRHFFDMEAAGLYAALAVLGKIIFYASSAVGVVLFPVVSERVARGTATHKLIVIAAGSVALLSLVLTAIYFVFPHVIISLLFGNAYAGGAQYLGLFGVFLALFSIGNIIALSCLALGKTGIGVVTMIPALLQIVGIGLFHESISSVILLNIAVSALFVLLSGGYYLKTAYEKV